MQDNSFLAIGACGHHKLENPETKTGLINSGLRGFCNDRIKRLSSVQCPSGAQWSFATDLVHASYFRSYPESGNLAAPQYLTLWANKRLMHCNKRGPRPFRLLAKLM